MARDDEDVRRLVEHAFRAGTATPTAGFEERVLDAVRAESQAASANHRQRLAVAPGRRALPSILPLRTGRWQRRAAALAAVALILLGAVGALRWGLLGPTGPFGSPSTQALSMNMLAALEADRNQIVHVHETTTWSGAGAPAGIGVDVWRSPSAAHPGQEVRTRIRTATHGALRADFGMTYTEPENPLALTDLRKEVPGRLLVTGERLVVAYDSKSWYDYTGKLDASGPIQLAWDDPDTIRSQIAAGSWRVAGRTQLNGHRAIQLVWTGSLKALQVPRWRYLWIDADTYLPLRLAAAPLTLRSRPVVMKLVADYEFMAPTTANLAKLRVGIPPGFTQMPAPKGPA